MFFSNEFGAEISLKCKKTLKTTKDSLRLICFRDRSFDDSYVSAIAASTIHMFQRSPPRRFICFRHRRLDDSYVSVIAASTIHMFPRSLPRRFVCFSDRCLDDLYVSAIAHSTIHMIPRSLPRRFICFRDRLLGDSYVVAFTTVACAALTLLSGMLSQLTHLSYVVNISIYRTHQCT